MEYRRLLFPSNLHYGIVFCVIIVISTSAVRNAIAMCAHDIKMRYNSESESTKV